MRISDWSSDVCSSDLETSVEETIVNKSLLYAVFFGLTASPAFADSTIPVGNGVTLLPSYDARLRYESVDQENGLENADALTVRVRAGLEIGDRKSTRLNSSH